MEEFFKPEWGRSIICLTVSLRGKKPPPVATVSRAVEKQAAKLAARNKKIRDRARESGRKGYAQGRLLEEKIAECLQMLASQGEIERCVRHEPNGADDSEGRDFSIWYRHGGEIFKFSFGVTTSRASRKRSEKCHPNVPTFFFKPQLLSFPNVLLEQVEKLVKNSKTRSRAL